MWHLVFISVHAVFAVAAFVAGLAMLLAPPGPRSWGRPSPLIHATGVTVMSATLPFSLAVGWSDVGAAARPVFIGLFALSLYMVWRALQAGHAWRRSDRGRLIDHVGFNLIALATGFLAVVVLRAGAGVVGILAVAIGVPILGHWAIHRLKARAARSASLAPVEQ
ncbi:hypothetical protein [Citricoccus alkalitolerans]|uniref:DUF2306 domain-containing protein n=1 Tax=Citricoccus alkalitolerans TaxID=246603 RepID=A0ABV8XXM3_9MICC